MSDKAGRWVSVVFPFILIVVAGGLSRLSHILTLNEKVVGRLCSVLRFIYGKNVVVLKEESSEEIYNYLQGDNRAVFYIGSIGAIKGDFYRTCLYEHELKGTYIKQTVGEYPSETMEVGGATNIYRIEAVDDAVDIERGMWSERTIGLEHMYFMEGTVKTEDSYESDESAGYFMYGPYWNLREGNYYVEFELEAEPSFTNESIGFAEVTSEAGQVILKQKILKYGELEQGAVRIDFSLDQEMDNVEFQIYKNEGCIVEIWGINYGFEGR